MRAQLIMECWNSADAKRKEEFVMTGVERWLEEGEAIQIEDFHDDGYTCRQYKLLDGRVYRVVVATKDMDKYEYEKLVEEYNKNFENIPVSKHKNI